MLLELLLLDTALLVPGGLPSPSRPLASGRWTRRQAHCSLFPRCPVWSGNRARAQTTTPPTPPPVYVPGTNLSDGPTLTALQTGTLRGRGLETQCNRALVRSQAGTPQGPRVSLCWLKWGAASPAWSRETSGNGEGGALYAEETARSLTKALRQESHRGLCKEEWFGQV